MRSASFRLFQLIPKPMVHVDTHNLSVHLRKGILSPSILSQRLIFSPLCSVKKGHGWLSSRSVPNSLISICISSKLISVLCYAELEESILLKMCSKIVFGRTA